LHKLKSRGCAILTVLDAGKAQHFLNVYGLASRKGEKYTGTQALKYMDRDLFCSPSKFKSDEMLLQTLRKDAKDKGNRARNKISAVGSAEQVDREFEYTLVRSGLWDYEAFNLAFVSQVVDARMGSIMFGKKNLALVARSDGTAAVRYRLDVPYSSVQSITTGSFQDPSVTITLSEAPRVYQQSISDPNSIQSQFDALGLDLRAQANPRRTRVTSLSRHHEGIISNCFVYRILISNPSKIRPIGLLLQRGWEMPPSIPWPISVFAPRPSCATEMDLLMSALCNRYNSFSFGLQFQVQRLAQNGYLPPARVLELLPHVLQLVHRSGGFTGADAIRKLSRQLPFAGPEIDGKVFAIEHLEKLLRENEKASTRELSHNSTVTKQYPHIGLVHKAIVTDGVISIAGRRFAFLGFSHSSLREQTCSFMAPFEHDGALLMPPPLLPSLVISLQSDLRRNVLRESDTEGAVKISLATVGEIVDIERNG